MPPPSQAQAQAQAQPLPKLLISGISLLLSMSHFPPHHPSNPPNPNPNPNPRNPNPNLNSSSFPTPQSLSNWLKPRLPSDSLSTWGTSPGTKNLHNLWLELLHGETSLLDSLPPLRTLHVVCVRLRSRTSPTMLLLESHQELSDGSLRPRGRVLSEKMKPGEDVEASARRAIKEELGSLLGDMNSDDDHDHDRRVQILMDSYERKVEERGSVSYPGLPACYVLHYVDAFVEGLPEGEFVTQEGDDYGGADAHGVATQAIHCRRHFWKWVPQDSV
ncbi:hypothetical protein vseg_012008 [Gypsophila vaccaria]